MNRERKLRWTPDEDAVLLGEVEKNPHNITAACRVANEHIGRGVDACRMRVNYLRDRDPSNPLFITIGRNKAVPNRKIVKRGCPIAPEPVKKSFWRQLRDYFRF